MLILSRKKNQAIILGEDIEILITDIKGDTVKIGIRAPRNVPVNRKEVYEIITRENIEASAANPDDLDQASSLI
jgi:carbon storage regulator